MTVRRFPPPWSVEEQPKHYVVHSRYYAGSAALRCSTIRMKSRAVGSEVSSRSLKSRQSNASTSTSLCARTSAVRRVSSRIPISPKTSPRWSVANGMSAPLVGKVSKVDVLKGGYRHEIDARFDGCCSYVLHGSSSICGI